MNTIKTCLFLMFTFSIFSISAEQEIQLDEQCTHVVDFGYNKFVISPYSQTIAVTIFDSTQGIEIFKRSNHNKTFFKLAPHYCPQQHINSCGIATAVMILNTVWADNNKTSPLSKIGSWCVPEENTLYGQFVWTEGNFYNKNVSYLVNKKILEGRKKIADRYHPGIELDRLTLVLKAQGLNAEAYHVDSANQKNIDDFRVLVKRVAKTPTQYMIVNYDLNLYTAQGGGHFSPIAAYETISDSVLIMDTWSASNTWIWVKLTDLYKSMNTFDGEVYRGYILVDQKPLIYPRVV